MYGTKYVVCKHSLILNFRLPKYNHMNTIKHCLCLDLKNDPDLIKAYEEHHKNVWPEVLQGLKDAGIHAAEIYRWSNRLFMILETARDFSFENKEKQDLNIPRILEWEDLMWKFQQSLPGVENGSKWQQMKKIFTF